MPANALVPRALAAAIVLQVTVAGLVLASGGPSAEAAVAIERAEILETAGLVDRTPAALTTAGLGEPVELAVAPVAPPPAEPPAPPAPPVAEPVEAPAPAEPAPAPAPAPQPAPAPAPEPAPAPAPAPAPRAATTPTPQGATRDGACETSMLGWMNEARGGAGRHALVDDPVVDHVALGWSNHLAGVGQLAHNPSYSDEVFAARPEAMTAGEVVGRGMDARAIFDEFMRSPAHRDAILRAAFTHGTVGCVRDAAGQAWVTANFWG
ncbi:MAG TPA: CAP domain-containing protein [Acidimicrobiales bacterium]|nr:CAP domain-containing protein [Acidimicrobiales bacterium]